MATIHVSQLQQILDSVAIIQSRARHWLEPLNPTSHVVKTEIERTAFNLDQLLAGRKLSTTWTNAAKSVFNNVDLLEMIFEELSDTDLRLAVQTCHATRTLLSESSRIRKIMCLEADHDCPGYLLLQTLRKKESRSGANVGTETITNDGYGHGSVFNYWVRFGAGEQLPRLTHFTRSMFVSQPPAKEVTISLNCCNGFGCSPVDRHSMMLRRMDGATATAVSEPVLLITSDTGVTIGEVLDMATSLRRDHRTCPWAATDDHDDQGYVMVDVEFGATVPLKCLSLPTLVEKGMAGKSMRARPSHPASREDAARWMGEADLRPYCEHKQRLAREGKPIPTLEEYLARRAKNEELFATLCGRLREQSITTSGQQMGSV